MLVISFAAANAPDAIANHEIGVVGCLAAEANGKLVVRSNGYGTAADGKAKVLAKLVVEAGDSGYWTRHYFAASVRGQNQSSGGELLNGTVIAVG